MDAPNLRKNNNMADLPKFTLDEVAEHASEESLWMVVRGKVYDLTEYLDEHPGGDIMLVRL